MKNKNINIVLVGGGGGTYRIAPMLLGYDGIELTTIQTVFDSGGHSKVLRDERGMLPPGDLRLGILALSDSSISDDLRVLLNHRFIPKGSKIDGATIGNLMLTALTEHYAGDLMLAIKSLSRICGVKGKVLPVSTDHANLIAILSDGSEIVGEGEIDTRSINDDRKIKSVKLSQIAYLRRESAEAIRRADAIVFCPGDLYTSVVPNLLVQGFKEAVSESRATLIQVVNIMTKKAETDGFDAADFARVISNLLGRKLDYVICNNGQISKSALSVYAKEKAKPVKVDRKKLSLYTKNVVVGDFATNSDLLRHNRSIGPAIVSCLK